MKYFFVFIFISILAGCSTTPPVVQEARNVNHLNTLSVTCSSPYMLKQDCSFPPGVSRILKIDNSEIKVGASEDGKIILVKESNAFVNSMLNFFTLNSSRHSKASNSAFYLVKNILDNAGIKINRVIPLKALGNIDGYILELDSDGYSLLKTYSVKP